MHDFDQFERRLAAAVRSDADKHIGPFEARSVARAAIAGTERRARRLGRGRGMMLLAAASLLLVGGALAAGSGFLRLPSVALLLPAPSVVEVATASPDATSPGPSESAAPSASPIPVAGPGGIWIPTGSMVTPRAGHTAVRLLDGRVLLLGGQSASGDDLTSADLYDPATGTWSAAGSISKPLVAATLLHDGRVLVLVVHGDGGGRRAEVYDPTSGTWTATGPMGPGANTSDGTLAVLRDGRVLAAGLDYARVYDPATGTWTATGKRVRAGGDFTVLRDGRVLDWVGAQVYDPASGTWTATGKMNDQGYRAAAALLSDGKVLVAGGWGWRPPIDYYRLDSAQVYDPVTGSWTAIANMHAETRTTAAFLQPDGKVLVVGDVRDSVSHAEVYDPATGTWTATALPVRPGTRFGAATLLSDGAVLVTGQVDDEDQPACTADLYDPGTGSWTTASTMLGCDAGSFTLLLDGTVLKAGGSSGAAELYVPAGVPMPPLAALPNPPPAVISSPTSVPTPLPPAAGPVPPNARSWKVTVDNQSSEPATLFVAEEDGGGLRLVGSATPNVVPAGATVKVTFLFPRDGGWIYANPRPGEGGSLVSADDIGIPGKIWIPAEGEGGWVSP